ncbi:Rho termination factor N-terminal domain-containing protein [Actinophytocola glycyrrhizae]|uniref:Rho termination factor N-terminal domain-containing protein n=1 Tax=Actinophytocola glycyrrhizae TaxID=2044873 RepID=A0ABV9RV32_9PSEU
MAEQPGNQTPDTPDVDETELRGMKADELRARARELNVSGASDMRKEELVHAVATATQEGESGGVRTGPESSKSLKYSQEITSPDDDPERPGRSLVTTGHEVIRQWAEQRDAAPATVEGTEHDDHLGVLRFDFPGYGGEDLRHVEWDEWFATFDERGLNFIYQEERGDGSQSNFFRLENPGREDA